MLYGDPSMITKSFLSHGMKRMLSTADEEMIFFFTCVIEHGL